MLTFFREVVVHAISEDAKPFYERSGLSPPPSIPWPWWSPWWTPVERWGAD